MNNDYTFLVLFSTQNDEIIVKISKNKYGRNGGEYAF